MPRSTPDYFPIQVLNTILGGSFSSRLNMNLREKHGYTYGAGSSFDMRADAGPFFAAAGVQTDKTAEALKEFFNELNAILKPVPADELARAKNYVALRFPSAFETTGDISRRLEDMLVYHLPDDYFSKYVQNIQAVTAADVAARGAEVHPARQVRRRRRRRSEDDRAGIRALNLGPIKVMTHRRGVRPEAVGSDRSEERRGRKDRQAMRSSSAASDAGVLPVSTRITRTTAGRRRRRRRRSA